MKITFEYQKFSNGFNYMKYHDIVGTCFMNFPEKIVMFHDNDQNNGIDVFYMLKQR